MLPLLQYLLKYFYGDRKLKQRTIFEKANALGNYLAKITIFVVIILAAIMVLTVLMGVFFRYVLRDSLGWTEELARYLMIWAALLSISIGIKDKEHVGIQLIIRNIPIKYARILNLLVNIIILIFLSVLSYKGMYIANKAIPQLSMGLGISMYWALLSIPVAGALAIIQQLIQIIMSFKPNITFNELLGETEVEGALKEVKI
ncbi:MAG: TRAP transporter small permease [Candidatus Atribacteria bacterium]|nr:MAG: TRAP transporter small permease [Candidatus Atribacteria bacterium]